MGIGAVIAGGCNLGHGVTGMSTMAVSSLVAISSIVLGNWTMVCFKFIKPMEEMESASRWSACCLRRGPFPGERPAV